MDFFFPPVLLLALLLVFGRTFTNPPRSDYWSALYVFAQVGATPDAPGWTSILTFDLWQHGTYRPLSHLLLFLEYKIFGTWFVGSHLLNFGMYFLSIALLYRLAVAFRINRVLAAAFLSVYALLLSHFDIVTWPFQLFSTSGFAAALLGFLLYIRFLKNGRRRLLLPVGACFAFAMLCSEVFAPWPLGLLWLTAASSRIFAPEFKAGKKTWRAAAILISVLYIVYLTGFILNRATGENTGPLRAPSLSQVLQGGSAVFFNLYYHSVAGNLVPIINTPLNMYYNLDLGGLIQRWYRDMPSIVGIVGSLGLILAAAGGFLLYRKGKNRLLLILGFLFFLYFSNFFVTAAARLNTNHIVYTLTQFRYQYIPNAMAALMGALLVDSLLRPKRRELILICCSLFVVLSANLFLVDKYVRIINQQLYPLKTLLAGIENGIRQGAINPDRKLYIDDRITFNMPPFCWNNDMARFMRGTYQWYFPREELQCFTSRPETAAWIIRADDYRTIYPAGISNNRKGDKP